MTHRRSIISRLPEHIRTQINEFLDANVKYNRILKWLHEQGYHNLEHYHISRWRETGYHDWLQAQEHQDTLDRQLQWAATFATRLPAARLQAAAMNLIMLKLFEAINRMDVPALNRMLECKPEKCLTLINALSRYSRAVLANDRLNEAPDPPAEPHTTAPKSRKCALMCTSVHPRATK